MKSLKHLGLFVGLSLVIMALFQNCGKGSSTTGTQLASSQDESSPTSPLPLDDENEIIEDLPSEDPVVLREVHWASVAGRSSLTLSADGLKIEKNDGSLEEARSVYADYETDHGTVFSEFRITKITSGDRQRLGLASLEGRNPNGTPTATASYGIEFDGSYATHENNVYKNVELTAPLKTGDVVGLLVNHELRQLLIYLNGVRIKTQSIQAGHKYAPFFFGNKNQNAQVLANFGGTAFIYPPDAQFEPLDNMGSVPRKVIGWSPTESAAKFITINADQLTVTKDDGTEGSSAVAYGQSAIGSGRYYMEYDVIRLISGVRQRLGIASTVGRVPLDGVTGEPSYGYDFNGTLSIHDSTYLNEPGGKAVKAGDTVGVALDIPGAKIHFYLNGVLQKSRAIKTTGLKYSPMFMGSKDSNGTVKANFGLTPFRYPAPLGYTALGF